MVRKIVVCVESVFNRFYDDFKIFIKRLQNIEIISVFLFLVYLQFQRIFLFYFFFRKECYEKGIEKEMFLLVKGEFFYLVGGCFMIGREVFGWLKRLNFYSWIDEVDK